MDNETIRILAIESSCDETAAAVVERVNGGIKIISNIIASQIDLHKKYGGVVPEVASRAHIEQIDAVVCEAMEGLDFNEISAIAVTYTPGLIGALLVGVNYAKALAFTLGIPLIAVNHIEGHICANYIENDVADDFVCLVVSGGHSSIIKVQNSDEFTILAKTRDDAAGEAFDKIARVLGLGYPGGPAISECAKFGNPHAFSFPRVKMEGTDDFSFSGVKTAVINLLNNAKNRGENLNKADVAASFQYAVCRVLADRAISTARHCKVKTLAIAGGVAANTLLKQMLKEECAKNGLKFCAPSPIFCTDNAAMIAMRALYSCDKQEFADLTLNAKAT